MLGRGLACSGQVSCFADFLSLAPPFVHICLDTPRTQHPCYTTSLFKYNHIYHMFFFCNIAPGLWSKKPGLISVPPCHFTGPCCHSLSFHLKGDHNNHSQTKPCVCLIWLCGLRVSRWTWLGPNVTLLQTLWWSNPDVAVFMMLIRCWVYHWYSNSADMANHEWELMLNVTVVLCKVALTALLFSVCYRLCVTSLAPVTKLEYGWWCHIFGRIKGHHVNVPQSAGYDCSAS